MAVSQVSPAHKDAVHTLLEGPQDMVRRHACGTHHPDSADVCGILQPTDPSQVSSSIRSPRAQKADNLRFKIGVAHMTSSLWDLRPSEI